MTLSIRTRNACARYGVDPATARPELLAAVDGIGATALAQIMRERGVSSMGCPTCGHDSGLNVDRYARRIVMRMNEAKSRLSYLAIVEVNGVRLTKLDPGSYPTYRVEDVLALPEVRVKVDVSAYREVMSSIVPDD